MSNNAPNFEDLLKEPEPAIEVPHKPNGPELWNDILTVVRRTGGMSAVIAGGAVRDFILDVEPKDIDVFVRVEDLFPEMPQASDGFEFIPTEGEARLDEYQSMNNVQVVFFYEYGGRDLQIVAVSGLPSEGFGAALVETFDLGLTRIWTDGVRPFWTEAFLADLGKNAVTRLLHDRPERSKIRAERFIARHGDRFRYVVKD